ncbi:PDR/VanB family oxidoreductase [Herbiconiux moechotypicola]|uniref:PDR/VanB family oxidoreductase n=1 Tax=Herbiconiux moechotypicola TaxID=637393 RepID=A0ABN3E241_9MICO|nr:PDR/VanB family oxidoreductase [Herbiconiux moechotypicola]MCS5731316.1 PDR/VanB family oxidoreductase [Herbiconiux moechotypicola]
MRGREGMLPLVVSSIDRQTPSIVSVVLEHPDREQLPDWKAGAHIDVQLVTRHERQYSLCGDPADARRYRIAVSRAELSRGASHYVHEFLRVGSRVHVRPPRNLFELGPAERYLLVAAGIGITPMLAMARELDARGEPFTLVYLVRDESEVAFGDELAEWGDRVRVHSGASDGRLDLAGMLAGLDPGTAVYACGPARFSDALSAAEAGGVLPAGCSLHLERFEPVQRETLPDEAFTVVCAESDITLQVYPDTSMLVALSQAGIELPASCRRGVCGTCVVPLLDGAAEHRDSLGADAASGVVYPCVSRAPGGTLTLGI